MQRKLFIGIDLDPSIKKSLTKSIALWEDLPIRWHDTLNYNIALMQIGWVGEDDVIEVSDILRDICDDTSVFAVDFTHINTLTKNPDVDDVAQAKTVRLVGEESEELRELYQEIADTLNVPVGQKKSFRPFVELGKIRTKLWEQLEEYPDLHKEFPITMDVFSVTLFENQYIEGKRVFTPIETFELQ